MEQNNSVILTNDIPSLKIKLKNKLDELNLK